jgi:hypothetical protein
MMKIFNASIQQKKIIKIWFPLAASWLLMGVEMPVISAVMARLANPEISLATHGGIVFPLALIIEAPIIMLLSASTALSKDWDSYQKIFRFMMIMGASLTVLHLLVAFTPLYDFLVVELMGVPEEIIESGRMGLRFMLPWTWSIAYRRFQQGVMIRFGHSQAVGVGTIVRLCTDVVVLGAGLLIGSIPGYIIGATSQGLSTLAEAVYSGIRVRPILKYQLKPAKKAEKLTWKIFFAFYIPLALTSFLSLVWQPIGSAALSRMPRALDSLAVWAVVSGLIFMLRSLGLALNEVVVAILDQPGSSKELRKFSLNLSISLVGLHFILAATPLALLWFSYISGLPPSLVELARIGFWFGLPMPILSVLQSWYQGAILFSRNTRGIPESMAIFLVTVLIVLGLGVVIGEYTGLYVGLIGFSIANFTQTIWLWVRSRPVMKIVNKRDENLNWSVG